MNFSAAILAGGKSSRMGRDKALVELDRAVGAAEIFICGRAGIAYPGHEGRVLTDHFPDAGPLAGIHIALQSATTPSLLVLAVDMPAMDADFLRQLVAHCQPGIGVVPRVAGEIEPLAAIYPKAALSLITELLSRNSRSVKKFADACDRNGLIAYFDVPAGAANHFTNCNTALDLDAAQRDHAG